MQNNPVGSKGTSSNKPLHNVAEAMRDSTGSSSMRDTSTMRDTTSRESSNMSNMRESGEQMMSDMTNKASRLASETMENASEYYDKASTWFQGNYGKAISFVGFAAAIGTIGYLIGRNSNRSEHTSFQSERI